MKLAEHTEHIRQLIDTAFRNRLGRMGITAGKLSPVETIPVEYHEERRRMETIREAFIGETGTVADAYEKLVEELTFTLFNRLAALKVMEAHVLHPEIVTQRETHGSRAFAHLAWLEQHPEARNEEAEGLVNYFDEQLSKLAGDIPLFSTHHPYHLLPTPLELKSIILAFNQVETDKQVEAEIWKSDDVLGWLYESYNDVKKQAHKDSKKKIEFNNVSLRSQTYTPRWVVKFLVDNSLGKLYLEMYPDSDIKNRYKIANAPKTRNRDIKPLHEIRLIDPANGSGNFLLYGFDLYYDLYLDVINNQGNPDDYEEKDIAKLIIEHNLHGIDLDDRAVQLAQLGLYIKAKRKKRTVKIEHFNVVSSDFFLPEYQQVKHLFENEAPLDPQLEKIVIDLWKDLQQAYKFGSLIRLEEKFSLRLHGLVKDEGITLFTQENLIKYEAFRANFFINLQKAVEQNTVKQGQTFLNTKTQDAITFLQLLTQKYDIAVANPPYTDSADFGSDLKKFIDSNYKDPYKFNINLYASFIKRCCELVDDSGKIAIVHPPTFMYIKTFEDVRKYLLERTHISLFVEWGYLGMFNPTARVDAVMYILEKKSTEINTEFIKLSDIYEGKRYEAFVHAYSDLINCRQNELNITIRQDKLKVIESWPFIYWISDEFREKFTIGKLGDYLKSCSGLGTGDNNRFMRFWWEINNSEILQVNGVIKKWVLIAKGGPYNKWFGNLWLVVNWENNGNEIKNFKDSNGKLLSRLGNEGYFCREGISFAKAGTKTASFRYIPSNSVFDSSSPAIFPNKFPNLHYSIAFLNSSFASYLLECLNPTAGTQVGDLQRIPFVKPPAKLEDIVTSLAKRNIEIKKNIISYNIIEVDFKGSPILRFDELTLSDRVMSFLNFSNLQHSIVLLNEAIINKCIFEVYNLADDDRTQIETKSGKSVGDLPVLESAKARFLKEIASEQVLLKSHVENLDYITFENQFKNEILSSFDTLYQANNNLEEFCVRNKINPINIWCWFKESRQIPSRICNDIALEYLTDSIRTLLTNDEEGIIPLVGLPGETRLLDRLELHSLNNGLSSAQFTQLDNLIGGTVQEYIEQRFFHNISDHLNLFPNLPKTPFIWHLSSGPYQGFEAYIIIYKWNRDSLFKLKSQYLGKREESLDYRKIQLQDVKTAQAQNEKEQIRQQLIEIAAFTKKIDELIAEGYDPKLDDGVGKNIAPLQKKGMLKAEVLNKKQLEKYLNADW